MNLGPNDEQVSRVAQAIEKAGFDSFFAAVASVDMAIASFKDFFCNLSSESDRALAIVTYAYIDERLRDCFQKVLNHSIAGGVASLLDGIAPLSSSGARIQMAGALYWLQPTTYKNLRILKNIRNAFAHHSDAHNFAHRRVAGLLSSMVKVEIGPLAESLAETKDISTWSDRDFFFVRTVLTCQEMVTQMATAPVAQRMGLHPMSVYSRNFESMPEPVKGLLRASAQAIIRFLG